MRKLLCLGLTLLSFTLIAGCHPFRHHPGVGCGNCPKEMGPSQPCAMKPCAMGAQGQLRPELRYACDCGADCKCNSFGKQPGNCACGKKLQQIN